MDDELRQLLREVLLASTGFNSAWEFGPKYWGAEEAHQRLRELVGITEQEWRASELR